jgi:hypothetical protein
VLAKNSTYLKELDFTDRDRDIADLTPHGSQLFVTKVLKYKLGVLKILLVKKV